MSALFDNAIQSIQLGVEDYQTNNPIRTVSAVRNFYAGVLLLAKEALARQAPKVNPKEVIGAQYKPVPDGANGISYVSASHRTIDFATIGERFRDFNLAIDQCALKDLNQIRNDLEHHFSKKSYEAVREALARAFPIVAQLFQIIREIPSESLGDSWEVMLDVRAVYEHELEFCQKSFNKVEWPSNILSEVKFSCLECQSDLVEQIDPMNRSHQSLSCRCRLCGYEFSGEIAVEKAIESNFWTESYLAMTDGGDMPVRTCPDCGLDTYLFTEEVGCVWCSLVLEKCGRCMTHLTPENVSPDNYGLCSYCNNLMQKDD